MSGYRKNGAQAVYLSGVKTNVFEASTSGTLNTSNIFQPVGNHLSITDNSLNTATTLTPPSDTNALTLGVEDQSIRLRMDGQDATTSAGFLFSDGDIVTFQFTAGTTFSVIETAASASIQYQWGKI